MGVHWAYVCAVLAAAVLGSAAAQPQFEFGPSGERVWHRIERITAAKPVRTSVSASGAPLPQPRSCADLTTNPDPANRPNGTSVIYAGGKPVQVLCDLRGIPATYMILPSKANGSNVFTYWEIAATAWTAVKLNIGPGNGNYSIDLTDFRYSSTSIRGYSQALMPFYNEAYGKDAYDEILALGFNTLGSGGQGLYYIRDSASFGTVTGCFDSGKGMVDLRGTPFAVVPNAWSDVYDGGPPSYLAVYSENGQVVSLQSDYASGGCAITGPDDKEKLALQLLA